jgi:predicted CoA-binding protein
LRLLVPVKIPPNLDTKVRQPKTNLQVSRSQADIPAVLAWYHTHGLPVTPINPASPEIKLPSHAYKTVTAPSALEAPTQTALSVITPPAVTRKILEEAKSIGIPAVWLQPGSFDEEGLEYAKANFEAAVGGRGGQGGEGWCVLVDGESALEAANRDWNSQKL